jgi:hypothetical protein
MAIVFHSEGGVFVFFQMVQVSQHHTYEKKSVAP